MEPSWGHQYVRQTHRRKSETQKPVANITRQWLLSRGVYDPLRLPRTARASESVKGHEE